MNDRLRRTGAVTCLMMYPKRLREDVAALPGFKANYDIPSEAEITFGSGPKFLRSKLFAAVRSLYTNKSDGQELDTEDGRRARLSLKGDLNDEVLKCDIDGKEVSLPSFKLLSPNTDDRIAELSHIARENGIGEDSLHALRARVEQGPIGDEDFGEITDNLKACPVHVRGAIREGVAVGQNSVDKTVPSQPYYYDRLIGDLGNATDLKGFVAESCKWHIERLLRWDLARGFSLSLLVAGGHSSISDLIDLSDRPASDVEEAFKWLAEGGDRFSQVAGVEIGLRHLEKYPTIEGHLIHMIEAIRDEDPKADNGRLALTASLFILADGEISRRRTLRDKPPFWRRLAALAQASLIERELIRGQVDIAKFSSWATSARGVSFFLQTLADLRLEPRWLPDFMSPESLKNEMISRIVAAAERLPSEKGSSALRDLLSSTAEGSLRSQFRFPQSFLPGPIEGGTKAAIELPAELLEPMEREPEGGVLDANQMAGLVNSALVFKIKPEHVVKASELVKKVRYQVVAGIGDEQAFALLSGLALLAAVTRNAELANDVRIVARVIRNRTDRAVGANDLMRIGMVAAASQEGLEDWARLVGDWFQELSYEDMSVEEATALLSHLRLLCELVPNLWRYGGRADAALAAAAQAA